MLLHRFCADVFRVFMGLSRATTRRYPFYIAVTAFVYLGCWFLMAGIVYYFIGFETKGKSIEQIDKELAGGLNMSAARVRQA